jgi:Tol biopolymer transport system component
MVRDDGPTLGATPVPGSSVLELLDLATGEHRDVVTSDELQLFSAVSVSPDGSRYCAGVETGDDGNGSTGSAIVVGRLAGGKATMVTKPKEYAAYCDWRPDGDQILYTTHDLNVFPDMTEDSDLHLMAPDGSGRRQLTHFEQGRQRATQPRWTPDGTRILFTLVEGDGHYDHRRMATVSPDGDDLRWATSSGPQSGTHPTLQPQ